MRTLWDWLASIAQDGTAHSHQPPAETGVAREYEVLTLSDMSLTTRTKEMLHCGAYADLIGSGSDADVIASVETFGLTFCS